MDFPVCFSCELIISGMNRGMKSVGRLIAASKATEVCLRVECLGARHQLEPPARPPLTSPAHVAYL